ncbi:hypothetical protein JOS77_01470 [Chromobacterium haemolyticum]|nr:hypothetical protein JOS77_01470 [Chromobacterium haemolyticum]
MNHTLIQAAVLGGFLVPAAGASALDEQILRHQQQQLELQREELQRRPDVLQSPSAPSPVASPAAAESHEDACFTVKQIALEGMPDAWRGWLPSVAAHWQGQCLGLAQLDQVVAELSNAMVERGYVTSRVYLPEQNLKQGRLRLAVVPGRASIKSGSRTGRAIAVWRPPFRLVVATFSMCARWSRAWNNWGGCPPSRRRWKSFLANSLAKAMWRSAAVARAS